MLDELTALEDAARAFDTDADDFVDPRRLAGVIDRLQGKLCRVVARAEKRGDHLLSGQSSCSWVAGQCQISKTAAADRLCVGRQLARMSQVAAALAAGEIGYQATSVICHLQERVDQIGADIGQEMWIENARSFSIKALAEIAAHTWHAVDPSGFRAKVEDDHDRRSLDISETAGMYRLDGWLELAAGAAVKTAIEALAHPLGEGDERTSRQRRADAITEMAQHVLDQGVARRRNGVRPHIALHTSIEGLKGELGAPASQLQDGSVISSVTAQRLACDSVLHRVLKADSMVVDVGRASRSVQPAQRRALNARHKTCVGPGCDRAANWTTPHHIEFWSRGGKSDLSNLAPLCYYHHRLVHEGGWQIVRTNTGYQFTPPDHRPTLTRRRWGERRWAA